MRKFLNLNEEENNVWTEKEMKELRECERNQGINVEENFELWLENKKEDFQEINKLDNVENNEWIPISSGLKPEEREDVQVTYIGYNDGKPYCDEFAYINDGIWYWTNSDSKVTVEITAWKYNCEPYMGE